MKSLTEHMKINLDEGLDRLIASTAESTLVLTGFTAATISSGGSRPARGANFFKPPWLPTTSNSGWLAKRYLMIREIGGGPAIRIVIFRTHECSLAEQDYIPGRNLTRRPRLVLRVL
jgi:hypothetical protein